MSVNVGPQGPVAIWSSERGEEDLRQHDVQEGGASFPRSRPSDEPSVALTAYSAPGAPTVVVAVEQLPFAFPQLQLLPSGTFLVVGSRCYWHEGGPEENAVVYADDGRELRRGTLGDGIEHVMVDVAGRIWTGYFDEGVFGNYGWGAPYGPEPLGAPGIVAWTPQFEQSWALDPSGGLVSDCYALNVADNATWACPYTDFPVLRIMGKTVQTWATEGLSGPRGIIAHGDRVALIGTYDDPSEFVLGRLGDRHFVEERRGNLWAPDGTVLPKSAIHCVGSVAHFFADRKWFSFDLRAVD